MATGWRRFRSGRLAASCAKSRVLFDFDSQVKGNDNEEFITRTAKGVGVRRLAARTAGAIEEMDMVVYFGEIRSETEESSGGENQPAR